MKVSTISQDSGPIYCLYFQNAKMRKVARILQSNIEKLISSGRLEINGQVQFKALENHSYGIPKKIDENHIQFETDFCS